MTSSQIFFDKFCKNSKSRFRLSQTPELVMSPIRLHLALDFPGQKCFDFFLYGPDQLQVSRFDDWPATAVDLQSICWEKVVLDLFFLFLLVEIEKERKATTRRPHCHKMKHTRFVFLSLCLCLSLSSSSSISISVNFCLSLSFSLFFVFLNYLSLSHFYLLSL